MLEVLRALCGYVKGCYRPGMTPNDIAKACGLRRGQDKNRHARDGRAMAPAQRVIFPLIALRKRGLVDMTRRPDGLSGTAYVLTDNGELFCREHGLLRP